MTWNEIGWRFAAVARRLKAEWKCDLPAHDTLPNEVTEQVVSAWCAVLARNLDAMAEEPPEIVKPWLIVRLHYAAKISLALGAQRDKNPPEKLDANTVRAFLNREWLGAGRDQWVRGLKLDDG
jgi:hypothetical protein